MEIRGREAGTDVPAELELELVQALAENELRRGRMLPPSEHEVLMVRQEAANTIGQSQPRRPTPR